MIREFVFKGNTYKVHCFDYFENHSSWFSFNDEQNLRDLWWDIKPGDYILDVGAAFGSWSLPALASGAKRVWAWSPQHLPGEEAEIDTFKKSVALNGWENRINLYETAVYNKTGWLNLGSGEFSLIKPEEYDYSKDIQRTKPWTIDEGSEFLIKPVETLDNWLIVENPEKIDYIKIDVEGAELEVLEGAEKLINKFYPKIIVENHLYKKANIEKDISNYMEAFGYTSVIINKITNQLSHSFFEIKS